MQEQDGLVKRKADLFPSLLLENHISRSLLGTSSTQIKFVTRCLAVMGSSLNMASALEGEAKRRASVEAGNLSR